MESRYIYGSCFMKHHLLPSQMRRVDDERIERACVPGSAYARLLGRTMFANDHVLCDKLRNAEHMVQRMIG